MNTNNTKVITDICCQMMSSINKAEESPVWICEMQHNLRDLMTKIGIPVEPEVVVGDHQYKGYSIKLKRVPESRTGPFWWEIDKGDFHCEEWDYINNPGDWNILQCLGRAEACIDSIEDQLEEERMKEEHVL